MNNYRQETKYSKGLNLIYTAQVVRLMCQSPIANLPPMPRPIDPFFKTLLLYPLIVQPLAPYTVLVRHILTTLQYTFKTLPELF